MMKPKFSYPAFHVVLEAVFKYKNQSTEVWQKNLVRV